MKLRVDPWDPEYGGSIELDPDLGPPPGLDLGVEVDGAWSPVPRPGVALPASAARSSTASGGSIVRLVRRGG